MQQSVKEEVVTTFAQRATGADIDAVDLADPAATGEEACRD